MGKLTQFKIHKYLSQNWLERLKRIYGTRQNGELKVRRWNQDSEL
jgi:hypothetical protein